jgi:hypothetical protein
MGLPWLGLIYALLDLTNLASSRRSRRPADEPEREQAERERLRAERLLKLDLLRQAGDREIGRLRLASVAVGWIGTIFQRVLSAGGRARHARRRVSCCS